MTRSPTTSGVELSRPPVRKLHATRTGSDPPPSVSSATTTAATTSAATPARMARPRRLLRNVRPLLGGAAAGGAATAASPDDPSRAVASAPALTVAPSRPAAGRGGGLAAPAFTVGSKAAGVNTRVSPAAAVVSRRPSRRHIGPTRPRTISSSSFQATWAFSGRFSTSFSSSRSTQRTTSGSRPGLSVCRDGTGSFTCLSKIRTGVSVGSENGTRPLSSSYAMIPTE